RGVAAARAVQAAPHGARLRHVGVVLCRQRPGNAGGVVFMTLEDETGLVSVVVRRRTFARYTALVRTAPLLEVAGRIERRGGAVHLVAERLARPRLPRPPTPRSRDFR
ncbi:MAG: hypothetical protein D6739_11660, partial [Nitrospirae bacterium]